MELPGDIASPEQLREVAMSPLGALMLSLSDHIPLALLGQAGLLLAEAHSLQDANRKAETILDVSKEPSEHQELYHSMTTAIEGAHVAFDAALNAAWQLIWVHVSCKCTRCQMRRQKADAHLS